MKVLNGIVASPGIAKGIVCIYSEDSDKTFPRYIIDKKRVETELVRLSEAFNRARETMRRMIKFSEESLDARVSKIFGAHLAILDDPILYKKVSHTIRSRFINAEHAVNDAFEGYIKTYKKNFLHFSELSHDIIDVKNRILVSFNNISGHFECSRGERQPVIVVSKRLTPTMILSIPKENILAFVTKEGGFTTHSTILAREYGIPVIFGVDIERYISCGDHVIVDGYQAKVFVKPNKATERYYSKKIEDIAKKRTICDIKRREPSQTKGGLRVKLKVNISTPGELELLKRHHYDGIGLLRTEFLFLDKDVPPSEEEQFRMYKHILEVAKPKPVRVRLLDIGQDKMPAYLRLSLQRKSDLEIRGARVLDFFYRLYLVQAKALLCASQYGNLEILYPMVSDTNDLYMFKKLIYNAKSILKKEDKDFAKNIKEGIMIETPAAAVMAKSLLKDAEFANIGSNDLLQYTLAVSRGDVAVEERYHILHPSLVKLMEMAIRAGKSYKKEVCLCGEIAGFSEFYPLFLSLGLRSFSVAASRLEYIKCELLHQDCLSRSLVGKFYSLRSKEELDRFFEKAKKRR